MQQDLSSHALHCCQDVQVPVSIHRPLIEQCSSTETIAPMGSSIDVITALFPADLVRVQLPTYGYQRHTNNRCCFSTSAAASPAADPATDGVLSSFNTHAIASIPMSAAVQAVTFLWAFLCVHWI